jgi:hypothetical protein
MIKGATDAQALGELPTSRFPLHRSTKILEYKNIGVQKYWSTKILGYKNIGVQKALSQGWLLSR